MKILFMGTPDFALPSLKTLQLSRHEISAVVTSADKAAGRGLSIQPSAVKKAALELNLPILQPADLNDPEFIKAIDELNAALYVVVAFRILPPQVFRIPPKGTINLHASLLPKYRGAAPINWAIINGETETGLTTFFIQEKVDTGDLILQRSVPISDRETAGELHDELAKVGAELLLDTVNRIEDGRVRATRQSGEASKAPKLTKDLARIDWHANGSVIHNLIRGLSPTPGAFSTWRGKLVKIYRTRPSENGSKNARPGEIIHVDRSNGWLEVATGSRSLEIIELQMEGKRRMLAKEFMLGHNFQVGDRFE